MENKILIKDGRLIDPASGTDRVGSILIESGKIMAVSEQICSSDAAVIDATGYVVAPGLMDVHVHFRDPGLTQKETLETGCSAAAAGGFTTVVTMANTVPVPDSVDILDAYVSRLPELPVHVIPCASVTMGMEGKQLADMDRLKEAGAMGFSDDGKPILDPELLRRALEKAASLGAVVSLHEEDPRMASLLGIHEGAVAEKLGLSGAPSCAESSMIARDCAISLCTGLPIHIQHVSASESVKIIRFFKGLGAKITAEATPQHFSLTEEAILTKGSLAKLNPPLRTEKDRCAVIEGLKDGTIDMIATDHAPHTESEKKRDFRDAPSGMIGLETALALGITNLVRSGVLSLSDLIGKMSLAPAELYRLNSGRLESGRTADLVVFDPEERWVVPPEFHSKSSDSPFIGEELYGKVKMTICEGKIVYSDLAQMEDKHELA